MAPPVRPSPSASSPRAAEPLCSKHGWRIVRRGDTGAELQVAPRQWAALTAGLRHAAACPAGCAAPICAAARRVLRAAAAHVAVCPLRRAHGASFATTAVGAGHREHRDRATPPEPADAMDGDTSGGEGTDADEQGDCGDCGDCGDGDDKDAQDRRRQAQHQAVWHSSCVRCAAIDAALATIGVTAL